MTCHGPKQENIKKMIKMTKWGVIGSGWYQDRLMVEYLMKVYIDKDDVIVSGHSPRNNYNNVDMWAERYAQAEGIEKIIHAPRDHTNKEYRRRNGEIAFDSDKILAFIPMGIYKSGTWNTIHQFCQMNRPRYGENLYIYNEFGCLWDRDKLPTWVRKFGIQRKLKL